MQISHNVKRSSLAHAPSSHQVSGKLVHLFWGKAAKRQTDKENIMAELKKKKRSEDWQLLPANVAFFSYQPCKKKEA